MYKEDVPKMLTNLSLKTCIKNNSECSAKLSLSTPRTKNSIVLHNILCLPGHRGCRKNIDEQRYPKKFVLQIIRKNGKSRPQKLVSKTYRDGAPKLNLSIHRTKKRYCSISL